MDNLLPNLLERGIRADRDHPCPGNHDLADRTNSHAQRAVQPLVFIGLEQAAVAALGNQQHDLFRRMDVAVRPCSHAEHPENRNPAAIQNRDERPHQTH